MANVYTVRVYRQDVGKPSTSVRVCNHETRATRGAVAAKRVLDERSIDAIAEEALRKGQLLVATVHLRARNVNARTGLPLLKQKRERRATAARLVDRKE